MKSAAYIESVEALSKKHDVTVRRELRQGGIKGAKAYPDRKLVVTYGITSQKHYFTALHEIGHCVLSAAPDEQQLYEEAEAWVWAVKNAICTPNARVRQYIGQCLQSYKTHAEMAAKATPGTKPNLPPEGHKFWEIVGWADIDLGKKETRRFLP